MERMLTARQVADLVGVHANWFVLDDSEEARQ